MSSFTQCENRSMDCHVRHRVRAIGVLFIMLIVSVHVLGFSVERPESESPTAREQFCGPLSLWHGCLLLGVPASKDSLIAAVRKDKDTKQGLVSFAQLRDAAAVNGLLAEGMRCDIPYLRSHGSVAILHVKDSHFICSDFRKTSPDCVTQVWCYDPQEETSRFLSDEELRGIWDKNALVISRKPSAAEDEPIRFESLIRDFGEVAIGGLMEFDFPFVNIGQNAIYVDTIKSSCDCTSLTATVNPVPPLGRSSIRSTYGLTGRKGRISRSAFAAMRLLTADTSRTVVVPLQVIGYITGDITVTPRFLFATDIPYGGDYSAELYLAGTKALVKDAVSTVTCSDVRLSKYVRFTVDETTPLDRLRGFAGLENIGVEGVRSVSGDPALIRIGIFVLGGLPVGRYDSTLRIDIATGKQQDPLSIPLHIGIVNKAASAAGR